MNKTPTWDTRFEQAWTQVPHLQTLHSNRLSHVSGCAPDRFGLGKEVVLPRGPPKPPNIAQARPSFNMVHSRRIPL
jgi:hypothetical protein